jgi:hypothetical protein
MEGSLPTHMIHGFHVLLGVHNKAHIAASRTIPTNQRPSKACGEFAFYLLPLHASESVYFSVGYRWNGRKCIYFGKLLKLSEDEGPTLSIQGTIL